MNEINKELNQMIFMNMKQHYGLINLFNIFIHLFFH